VKAVRESRKGNRAQRSKLKGARSRRRAKSSKIKAERDSELRAEI
jgi:hypothetical protein